MNDADDDLDLLRRARGLEREVPPGRDLWPRIRDELDTSARVRQRRSWRIPLALAASLLVAITSVVLWQAQGRAPGADPAVLPVGLDPQLVQTRAQLIASLDAELARMSPESRAVVADSLAQIDAALAAIHAELDQNPNSELLLQLLVSTYTDQIILLGEMDTLARAIRQRTHL